ncbi:hypothetical protein AVEN_39757-1 [Araneus ventricosus]|uniref:Uncharacterized protein n=1 Tax=Araneus ventricosus TaxID=182803 RepID=A0A4Y2I6H3_ARAVE|nr:hypothetical protein AVEN_39757-1 [Araneus ventricosus]
MNLVILNKWSNDKRQHLSGTLVSKFPCHQGSHASDGIDMDRYAPDAPAVRWNGVFKSGTIGPEAKVLPLGQPTDSTEKAMLCIVMPSQIALDMICCI